MRAVGTEDMIYPVFFNWNIASGDYHNSTPDIYRRFIWKFNNCNQVEFNNAARPICVDTYCKCAGGSTGWLMLIDWGDDTIVLRTNIVFDYRYLMRLWWHRLHSNISLFYIAFRSTLPDKKSISLMTYTIRQHITRGPSTITSISTTRTPCRHRRGHRRRRSLPIKTLHLARPRTFHRHLRRCLPNAVYPTSPPGLNLGSVWVRWGGGGSFAPPPPGLSPYPSPKRRQIPTRSF